MVHWKDAYSCQLGRGQGWDTPLFPPKLLQFQRHGRGNVEGPPVRKSTFHISTLGDEIEVFRGCVNRNRKRMSWEAIDIRLEPCAEGYVHVCTVHWHKYILVGAEVKTRGFLYLRASLFLSTEEGCETTKARVRKKPFRSGRGETTPFVEERWKRIYQKGAQNRFRDEREVIYLYAAWTCMYRKQIKGSQNNPLQESWETPVLFLGHMVTSGKHIIYPPVLTGCPTSEVAFEHETIRVA